jgi:hypothetical protein
MATAQLHPVFEGIHGRSGEMVFRRTRTGIVIARRPDTRERNASSAQQAQRERFALAADYARRVLTDPWQRKIYERIAAERNRRVDKLLMSDFLTPPVVEEIGVSGFRGHAGDVVRVLASDDIAVTSVEVAIETASGAPVEKGSAANIHGVWCYTARVAAPAGEATVIRATARDRPGNEGRGTSYQPLNAARSAP